jgi:hypothetical protein
MVNQEGGSQLAISLRWYRKSGEILLGLFWRDLARTDRLLGLDLLNACYYKLRLAHAQLNFIKNNFKAKLTFFKSKIFHRIISPIEKHRLRENALI